MALVVDRGAVTPGITPCVLPSSLKLESMGLVSAGEDIWPEGILDFECLASDNGEVETSGAPNTPPDFEQDHASIVRSKYGGADGHGGSSPESGRESTEGPGMNQCGSMQPTSANSDHPHVASAEAGGGGEEPVASPRRSKITRQSSGISDPSSAKGSGKGSGKVSMEGSGEGPVKSSRADGPFEGVRHYDGMCGNSNMAMPEDMGDTDDISIFLRNLSWWWRSEDLACKLFAVQRFQSYSCNREHAMIIAQTSGAIRFLVHILQLDYCPGNDPCKVSAAFAMQNLAYHCSTTRERIAQAGAIPVLIQLLQSLDDSVREASAGCLANLAMEPGILDDIVARDGVPFILQLLRSSSLGCIEEGLCFLFLFASKSYDNQVLLARYGVIPLLVHMLAGCLSPRAKRLVGLFWTMYLPCADRLVQHELAKVTPLLMQLIQCSAPDVQDAAAILLADFCKQDDDNAHLVRKAGGVALFTKLYHARSNTHPVWGRVMDVLMCLGVDMFQEDVLSHSTNGGSGGPPRGPTPAFPRTTSGSGCKSMSARNSRACSVGTAPSHNPGSPANPMGHPVNPMPNPAMMLPHPHQAPTHTVSLMQMPPVAGMHVPHMAPNPPMMVMQAGNPMMGHPGGMPVPVPMPLPVQLPMVPGLAHSAHPGMMVGSPMGGGHPGMLHAGLPPNPMMMQPGQAPSPMMMQPGQAPNPMMQTSGPQPTPQMSQGYQGAHPMMHPHMLANQMMQPGPQGPQQQHAMQQQGHPGGVPLMHRSGSLGGQAVSQTSVEMSVSVGVGGQPLMQGAMIAPGQPPHSIPMMVQHMV